MKRIFIIVLVISLLVVPVAADSWYSDFQQDHIDILDYATPNGLDSFSLLYNSGNSIVFNLPTRYYFAYFDILVTLNSGTLSGATIDGKNLTVLDCGNRLYRLYGQFSRATYQDIQLVLTTTVNGAHLNFLSFDAYANHSSPVGLTGQFTWERFADTTEQGTREQTSFRDSVSINKPAFPNAIYDSATLPWKIFATADDWNKYDFLSFGFTTDMSIDSISVNSDLGQLPFTTNEILIGNDNSNVNTKFISVVVDVRGIPRNSTSIPTVLLTLSQDASIPGNFALLEVLGYFDYDYEEPDVYWLRRLFHYSNTWWSWLIENLTSLGTSVSNGFSNVVSTLGSVRDSLYTRLSNIFDSINSNFSDLKDYLTPKFTQIGTWITNLRDSLYSRLGSILDVLKSDSSSNNQAADDFNNSVETQADELQDMSDVMNSVDRPEIDDIDVDFSKYVSQSDISGLTAPLEALFSGDIFGVVLILSVMMGTVSFVFYGKR